MSSEDIVNTHDTFMKSLGIELSEEDKRLPYLYRTPKLHKSAVKHRFIDDSSKCTTKELFSLLTKILTVIKTGLEKYCSIKASHTGVNNMSILKNSTNLLSSVGHLGAHRATSIQTFDFSALYTSIPHDLVLILLFTCYLLFTWICCLDLSKLKLIVSCDGCHA